MGDKLRRKHKSISVEDALLALDEDGSDSNTGISNENDGDDPDYNPDENGAISLPIPINSEPVNDDASSTSEDETLPTHCELSVPTSHSLSNTLVFPANDEATTEGTVGRPAGPRKRNPSGWKKNIRKNKKATGQAYITVKGKVRAGASLKPNPCSGTHCQNNCKIWTDDERQATFQHFWTLSNEEKKSYILAHSNKSGIKR